MNKKQETKEKTCTFYASDYHFEMISLPYINQKIETNNEIIILTQTNLEETMKDFLEKTNIKPEKKEQILKLNWKNENRKKLKNIKEKIKEEKEIIIFIKGKKEYIQKTNQELEKYKLPQNRVKIIDCYSLEEIGENLDYVMDQYHKILKTAGEKEIQKV